MKSNKCIIKLYKLPYFKGFTLRSDEVKKGFDRTPHRSLLRATGLKDEDFNKPFIGVANSFIEIIPGHFF